MKEYLNYLVIVFIILSIGIIMVLPLLIFALFNYYNSGNVVFYCMVVWIIFVALPVSSILLNKINERL